MTSDERVQIYVPSPQTTPYNTITKGNSSTHHSILPWGAGLHNHQATPSNMRDDATPPPYAHRTVIAEHRSVTPIYLSNSSNSTTVETTTSSSGAADSASAKIVKTSSTSLEQIRVSFIQQGGTRKHLARAEEVFDDEEEETDATVNYHASKEAETAHYLQTVRQKETSAGEKTLAGDLPSLPRDEPQEQEPVSLSDINLTEETN